jgi:hypothetical protein
MEKWDILKLLLSYKVVFSLLKKFISGDSIFTFERIVSLLVCINSFKFEKGFIFLFTNPVIKGVYLTFH